MQWDGVKLIETLSCSVCDYPISEDKALYIEDASLSSAQVFCSWRCIRTHVLLGLNKEDWDDVKRIIEPDEIKSIQEIICTDVVRNDESNDAE